jgi:hypothetical protein
MDSVVSTCGTRVTKLAPTDQLMPAAVHLTQFLLLSHGPRPQSDIWLGLNTRLRAIPAHGVPFQSANIKGVCGIL